MLGISEIKPLVPRKIGNRLTPVLINRLNTADSDQFIQETIENIFRGYLGLLSEYNYGMEEYIDASIFVGYKFHGFTNLDSFKRTFPKRYNSYILNGADSKEVASIAAGYSRRGVVSKLIEQSMSKMWVLNMDNFQKAIDVQVDLMQNAKSEKVRCDAANSVLTHLGKPKDTITNNHINIDLREHTGLADLKDELADLAQQQLNIINMGISAKEIIEINPMVDKENKDD
ncbi:MAG: hypothetical protein LC099_12725 [Anaerolineales bacterium]|nr:hypothetical protein [Anaerolineales bacterium]